MVWVWREKVVESPCNGNLINSSNTNNKSNGRKSEKETRNSGNKYHKEKETKPIEPVVNNDKKHGKPKPPIVSMTCHDDMVEYEILSKLPVKSLMRFKSVCKRWESLIKKDPNFISLHSTRSKTRPCFLTGALPVRLPWHWSHHLGWESQGGRYHEFLCSTNLLRIEDETITIFNTLKSNLCVGDYELILRPVNGLLCIVAPDLGRGFDVVRIYNPRTRESTTHFVESNPGIISWEIEYGFGFDPVTEEHKVICMWKEYNNNSNIFCEVLTVGQTTWRRIHDQVPSYDFKHGHYVYSGGCIYWSNKKFDSMHHNKEVDIEDEVLVVFDVGEEKFRVVSVPNLINDRPLDTGNAYNGLVVGLLEVDGRVAIVHKVSSYIVKLCIFEGCIDKNSTSTTTRNNNWTQVTINLPIFLGENTSLFFHTIPGTDQIILETYEIDISLREITSMLLYSYDWKEKTFKKLKIDGIPYSTPYQPCAHATSLLPPVGFFLLYQPSAIFRTFHESLWPVRKQGEAKPQTSNY